MNNIIHEIYNNFLLRDVIAKVVPGTVVLLSTAVLASARPPWELLGTFTLPKCRGLS